MTASPSAPESPAATAVAFDFEDPDFQADPYPTYAALREHEPVAHRVKNGFHAYWLTRHEDVVRVLRDERFTSFGIPSELEADGIPETFRRLGQVLKHMMLRIDGADHTRLRGLVNKAFTPRMVSRLEPRLEAICASLLDEVAARGDGHVDLIRDLATPLPVIAIAELLGVPNVDQPRFKQWSDEIAVVLDSSVRTAGLARAAESAWELAEYLRHVVAERRREPREDLLSGMAAARDEHGTLSDDELISNAILLLLAGHETTTNLIGNGALALLRHPDQLDLLRSEPGLAASTVEEVLRYDSPVQLTARVPAVPVQIRGVTIPTDAEATLSLAGANRDPRVFPDAERFDIRRDGGRHLSFGFGSHFCLGASLARLEGAVAFRQVAARFPRLALADAQPPRRAGLVLRGLAALPASF